MFIGENNLIWKNCYVECSTDVRANGIATAVVSGGGGLAGDIALSGV